MDIAHRGEWLKMPPPSVVTLEEHYSHPDLLGTIPRALGEALLDLGERRLRETSMVFKKGHQLVLEIRGQDTQIEEPVWYHQCNPIPTEHRLQLGGADASYLLLPVIDT
jgi:hypothetical protein